MLIICSTLAVMTRRWYLFLLIGYYFSYAIVLLIKIIREKDKELNNKILKNGILFATIFVFVVGLSLFPIIRRTLVNNYGTSYGAWNVGGLYTEIQNQVLYIGIIIVCLMLIGIVYSFINKKTLDLSVRMILSIIISLFLFTRIQNMGYHQSLMLVPGYLLLSFVGIIGLLQFKKQIINFAIIVIIIVYELIAYYGSITNNYINNILFSNISLAPIYRHDYEKIGEIIDYIEINMSEDDKVYINAADGTYCSQTFSQYIMPDTSLLETIIYEASIDSVHGFPVEMLDAKYVFITNEILESTGAQKGHIISNIKYAIEEDPIIKTHYNLVKEFKINEELTFYAYERIQKYDYEEINEWKKILEEQSKLYPKLFEERLDNITV